jgi:hypothetical protein
MFLLSTRKEPEMATTQEETRLYKYELEARFEEYLNERYADYHFPRIVGDLTVSITPYNILKNAEPAVYDNALYEFAEMLKEEEGIVVIEYND